MTNPQRMHIHDEATAALRERIFDYSRDRMQLDPPPLDKGMPFAELRAIMPDTVTEAGIGGDKALDLFGEILAPASMSTDHPAMVSFIPVAPTEASILFDLVVSASCIFGGSWLEGAGAIYAENEVLKLLATEAGMPEGAGGVFVQGGTNGNLSALVAARFDAEHRLAEAGKSRPARWSFVTSDEAHSSLAHSARVMDVDVIKVPVGADGRMTGADVAKAVGDSWGSVFAVVATGGTTNFGIVDDIASVVATAKEHGIWVHVDGAYGIAGMFASSTKPYFAGLGGADSFIVDPHKWLYAPYDSCALIYRNPSIGRAAHTQHASYLDVLTDTDEWNPSDFAVHLSRRARGLPLWFSLATHGVAAYREAIELNNMVAREIADVIRNSDHLELVRDPMLSVVVFRRIGWTQEDYTAWSDELWESGKAACFPSKYKGEPVLRFAIVNPRTTVDILMELVESLKG
jgi:glutamate/tyrosine decarboxylase-like PLP-dependent enzyme